MVRKPGNELLKKLNKIDLAKSIFYIVVDERQRFGFSVEPKNFTAIVRKNKYKHIDKVPFDFM